MITFACAPVADNLFFHLSLADAWLHRLDPFAIRISGNFGIRWYGLAYALGFVVAYFIARLLAKKHLIQLSPQQVGDFIIASILGVMIGGRLGWVLFYSPSALWTLTPDFPWWEVLAINRGGMASHGGMIGVVIAMTWFARRNRISPFHLLDISALLVPFGLFFGRIANFINGELRGNPCPPDYPLAVKFPQEILDEWGPKKIAEAIGAADAIGISHNEWMRIVLDASEGKEKAISELLFIKERLVQLVQAGNEQVISVVKPLLVPRYPSQLFQAVAEGIVLGSILWLLWWFLFRKGRFADNPGFTGVAFLIIYGILRIITELWRQPDIGIGRTLGLSRGQWLSVGMIAAGLIIMVFLVRKLKSATETAATGHQAQ